MSYKHTGYEWLQRVHPMDWNTNSCQHWLYLSPSPTIMKDSWLAWSFQSGWAFNTFITNNGVDIGLLWVDFNFNFVYHLYFLKIIYVALREMGKLQTLLLCVHISIQRQPSTIKTLKIKNKNSQRPIYTYKEDLQFLELPKVMEHS